MRVAGLMDQPNGLDRLEQLGEKLCLVFRLEGTEGQRGPRAQIASVDMLDGEVEASSMLERFVGRRYDARVREVVVGPCLVPEPEPHLAAMFVRQAVRPTLLQ